MTAPKSLRALRRAPGPCLPDGRRRPANAIASLGVARFTPNGEPLPDKLGRARRRRSVERLIAAPCVALAACQPAALSHCANHVEHGIYQVEPRRCRAGDRDKGFKSTSMHCSRSSRDERCKTEIEGLRASRNAISAGQGCVGRGRASLGAEAKAAGSRRANSKAGWPTRNALKAMMLSCPDPVGGRQSGPTRTAMSSSGPKARGRVRVRSDRSCRVIEKNDWAELSRIVQVAGSRTYCLKGG